jgi:hypothetical protein
MVNLRASMFALCVAFLAHPGSRDPAQAHDIYTGVHGKDGQYCCSGDPLTGDCSATSYRERNGGYEFLTREGHWIPVPTDRITFLPIAGDPPSDNPHHAHLCYKTVSGPEVASDRLMTSDGQSIIFYCAHIPPQSY